MPPSSDSTYPGKVSPGDIFEVFSKKNESVLSTTDIDDEIGWASRSTVRRQLIEMRDSGELESKKSGEQENAGEVWYPSGDLEDVPQPTPNILKLIYEYPWYSIGIAGFFMIAFGFTLFMPGYFGEGQFLGVIERRWMVYSSLALYGLGVSAVTVGGFVVFLKTFRFAISDWRNSRRKK